MLFQLTDQITENAAKHGRSISAIEQLEQSKYLLRVFLR